jgi:ubiquitin-protein ligase E3 A
MLDYDRNVENDFLCTFKIGYTDVFGSNLSHDLKENGGDIPVTNGNKKVSHCTCSLEKK